MNSIDNLSIRVNLMSLGLISLSSSHCIPLSFSSHQLASDNKISLSNLLSVCIDSSCPRLCLHTSKQFVGKQISSISNCCKYIQAA